MTWVFQVGSSADYGTEAIRVYVCKTKNNRITSTYQCTALQALDLTLSAGQNVGVGSITLGNQDGSIFQDPAAQPHAMDILHIRGRNKTGTWGPMWTGYIDTVHQVDDPQAGRTALLTATSPQKIFEIRLQLPGDVAALALSSIGGLSGTAILKYVCSQTTVAYPGALKDLAQAIGYEPGQAPGLVIDPNADTGIANWQGIAQAVFLDPAQQSWEAVLEGLLADSGVQWFFDEMGNLYWQQPKYINGKDGLKPIILTEDDLFSRDLAESDSGVVTSVTVRYGIIELNAISVTKNTDGDTGLGGGIGQLISGKSANPIRDQLGTRVVVIYANWIKYQDAAANLANLLLQMYASNVLVGTIIIPPDPTITIGSLVQLPTGRRITGSDFAEQGIYYVAAIEYTLSWGSSYVMVLGLQYGRGINTGWAYPGAQPYPQTSLPPSEALNSSITSFAPGSTTRLANTFTILPQSGLADNVAVCDPAIIPPGTTFMLTSISPSGSSASTTPVGTSNTGVYTATAGKKGQGYVIYIKGPSGTAIQTVSSPPANVTLIQGASAAPVFTGDASGGTPGGPSSPPSPSPVQEPLARTTAFSQYPFSYPFEFTQKFGQTTLTSEPSYYYPPPPPEDVVGPSNTFYAHFHAGVDLSSTKGEGTPVLSVARGRVVGISSVSDQPIPAVNNLGLYRCNIAQQPCISGCNFIGYGNNVVVDIGGFLVHYAHLDSVNPVLASGHLVQPGTLIGAEGVTTSNSGLYGSVTGAHVHLGVWDLNDEQWVDPADFFNAGKFPLGAGTGNVVTP